MTAQPNTAHTDSAASSPTQHALPQAGAATVLPAVPSHAAPATFHLHFAADVWSMRLLYGKSKPEYTGSIYGKDSDGHGLTIDVKAHDLQALNRARRAICAMSDLLALAATIDRFLLPDDPDFTTTSEGSVPWDDSADTLVSLRSQAREVLKRMEGVQ